MDEINFTPEQQQQITEAAHNLAEWAKQTSMSAQEFSEALISVMSLIPPEVAEKIERYAKD